MGEEGFAEHYAVVGHPVAHSLSPRIHRNFAELTGQRIEYDAIDIEVGEFTTAMAGLRDQGLRGVNVTVPFKRDAFELCAELSPRARVAGAVNTLIFRPDATLAGDNTDGVGLTRDLRTNLQVPIERRKILILGAGGAVRGVLGPLLTLSPQSVALANRTLDKAATLAADFANQGTIQVFAYDDLGDETFDLIINGTAASLENQVPPVPAAVLGAKSICYDMMYSLREPTAFVTWALTHGAVAAHDGLGMLVEQAAEAFFIWRGVHPATTGVIRSLRQA